MYIHIIIYNDVRYVYDGKCMRININVLVHTYMYVINN